jgi:hypothetical protein
MQELKVDTKLVENVAKNVNLAALDPPELFQIDLLKPLKDFFSWAIGQIVVTFEAVVKFLKKEVLDRIIAALKWLWDLISEKIIDAFTKIQTWIKDFLTPTDPEKAFGKMGLFASVFVTAALGIKTAISSVQIEVFGCKIDLEPVEKLIHDLINPQYISSITLGILLSRAIEVPLKFWANATFRPFFPNPQEAWLMWRCGYIDESTYLKIYRYVGGFPDTFRKGFEEMWDYNPSTFDLWRVIRNIPVSEMWVTRKLIERGFEDEDIAYFKEAIFREPIRDEIEKVTSILYTLYKEGWITKDRLQSELLAMKFRTEEIFWRVANAEWLRFYELKVQKMWQYIYEFRKDLVDKETFEKNLKDLGLAIDFVNIIVAKEIALKGVKVVYLVESVVPQQSVGLTVQVSTEVT